MNIYLVHPSSIEHDIKRATTDFELGLKDALPDSQLIVLLAENIKLEGINHDAKKPRTEYYQENKEKIKANARRYYAENRERLINQQKQRNLIARQKALELK